MTPPDTHKLRDTFAAQPLSSNPSLWQSLYSQSHTPWDRAGPSLALSDLLSQRTDLVPPPSPASRPRPSALVPGCGPGHDALLLGSLGYDVVGLDFSHLALQRALDNQHKAAAASTPSDSAGRVTWLNGDFFQDDWLAGLETAHFDLIFDYTFLCALQPQLRPQWAKRISQLLAPNGLLICLEYPSGKHLSQQGPPWSLWPDVYEALLASPGSDILYNDDGTVASSSAPPAPHPDALHRICLIKPTRTHKAGTNPDGSVADFISVWRK